MMRSLIVAIKDELNEGNFLGTAGSMQLAKLQRLYPAPHLTASPVCGEKERHHGRVERDNQY
jgi:hypothetical protein